MALAYVVLSRFVVANGLTAEVKAAFRQRPHLVDDAPGFIRMDVLSPLDRTEEIWLITYWVDAQSFKSWHHSQAHKEAHQRIPVGLKLMPGETELRFFELVSS